MLEVFLLSNAPLIRIDVGMETTHIVIITTCPNQAEADELAKSLVENHLAACVQSNSIKSTYLWEGALHQDDEVRLMIKTTTVRADAVREFIEQVHSYDTPQVIALPILGGSAAYLDWIDQKTKSDNG